MLALRGLLVWTSILAMTAAIACAADVSATRTHVVSQIFVGGKPVASASDVTVTPAAGVAQRTITRGEIISDGTRVDVPASTVVVIQSTGAKSTVTLEPGASLTFVSTGKGELVRSNGGKALFDVVHASLDFYQVRAGNQITAGVNGTRFSIDTSGATVKFACTRDEVSIEKTGLISIGSDVKPVTLIDVVVANRKSSISYRPSKAWYLAPAFKTPAEASRYFDDRVTEARAAGDPFELAAALMNAAYIEFVQGSFARSERAYRESLGIYRRVGDRDGEADALDRTGELLEEQGRYDEGSAAIDASLELFKQLGDLHGIAIATLNAGVVQVRQDHYAEGAVWLAEARDALHAIGDTDNEARALGDLGVVQLQQGRTEDALATSLQALELFDKNDEDAYGAGRASITIGQVLDSTGKYPAALKVLTLAVDLCRIVGDRDGEAKALYETGLVQADQGQSDAAIQTQQKALAILRASGDPNAEAYVVRAIGNVQLAQGHSSDALKSLQDVKTMFHSLGDRLGEAGSEISIGRASRLAGQNDEALGFLRDATSEAAEIGDVLDQARALDETGLVYEGLHDDASAIRYCEYAFALYTQTGTHGPGIDENAANVARIKARLYGSPQ